MSDLRAAIAGAETRIARLRAANDAARLRLSPDGHREHTRASMRRLAVGVFVVGFAVGHVNENDRRHEHARVETILHGERMYSKHYEDESCMDGRNEIARQMLRCRDEIAR